MDKGPEEEDGALIEEATSLITGADQQQPSRPLTINTGSHPLGVMTAEPADFDPPEGALAPPGNSTSPADDPDPSAPAIGKGKTILKSPFAIDAKVQHPEKFPDFESQTRLPGKTVDVQEEEDEEEAEDEDDDDDQDADDDQAPDIEVSANPDAPDPAESNQLSGDEDDDEDEDEDGEEQPEHVLAKENENDADVDEEEEENDDDDDDDDDEDGQGDDAGDVKSTNLGDVEGTDHSEVEGHAGQESEAGNEEDGDDDGDDDDDDEEQLEIVEAVEEVEVEVDEEEEEDSDEEVVEVEHDDDEPHQPSAFGGRTTTSHVGRVLVSDANNDPDDADDEDDDADDEDDGEVEYAVVEEENPDEGNASGDGDEDNDEGEDQTGFDGDEDDSKALNLDTTRDTNDTMDEGDDQPIGYEDDDDDDLDDDDDDDIGDVSVPPNTEEKYEDDEDDDEDGDNNEENREKNEIDENIEDDDNDRDDDEGEDMDGQAVDNTGLTDQENVVYDGEGPYEDDDLEDDDDENDNLSGLDNVIGGDPNGELPPAEFLSDDLVPQQRDLEGFPEDDQADVQHTDDLSSALGDTGIDNGIDPVEAEVDVRNLSLPSLGVPLTGKRSGDAALGGEGNKDYLNEEESRKGGAENDMNGIEDQERERKKARIA